MNFEDIEASGRGAFLDSIREGLLLRTCKPRANCSVEIPKGNGKVHILQIPCIQDRAVQGVLELLLEAIFEACAAE